MDTWVRGDGRWYVMRPSSDLFGMVVEIRHGGRYRPGRMRLVAVRDEDEARSMLLRLEKRRAARGYRRVRT